MKFILIISLFLFSCSDEHHARGVTSETTNGGKLMGNIITADGRPASGTLVLALREDPLLADSARMVLGSDSTDANGNWKIEISDTTWHGNVLYVVECDGDAVMARATTSNAQELRLAPMQRLQGKAVGNVAKRPVAGLQVSILGLGKVTHTNANGEFSFGNLPAGNWVVRVRDPESRILVGESAISTVSVTDTTESTMQIATSPQLLWSSFDAITFTSELQALLGDSYMGTWRDTSMENPWPIYFHDDSVYTEVEAWSGKSFHAVLTPYGAAGRTAGLSGSFGGAPGFAKACWHDLDQLDSVQFMVKGSGTVEFGIFARSSLDTLTNGRWAYDVELKSTWTQVSFAISDLEFRPESWSNQTTLTWENSRFLNLQWGATSTTDFWLDDVVLFGMWPTDLLSCNVW